jgi:hypothetical protein
MITRTGIVNDLHIPWHDPKLVDLVIFEIFKDIKVDRIVLNGDMLDFYACNMHSKNKHPLIQESLHSELQQGKDFFKRLRKAFPKTEIVFLYGNHEDRLSRFLINSCPPAWHLLRLDLELDLERLDIEWYDYNHRYQLEKSNLFIQHSPRSYASAKANFNYYSDTSSVFGCSHRFETAYKTGTHDTYVCHFNGWLSQPDLTPEHEIVFQYIKGHKTWQNGFAIATCIDEKEALLNAYHIKNNRVTVDGYLYEV